MATETSQSEPPRDLDLHESPFQRQAIEALPLTKAERQVVREVIEEARREREAHGRGSERP